MWHLPSGFVFRISALPLSRVFPRERSLAGTDRQDR